MFDNIIVLDPLFGDLMEHNLYLIAYEHICKKLKLSPQRIWFITEKSGKAYNLDDLLMIKNYKGYSRESKTLPYDFNKYMTMDFKHTLFIVNWKRNPWLPSYYANISHTFGYSVIPELVGKQVNNYMVKQNKKSNIIGIYPGDFHLKEPNGDTNRFCYIQNLDTVPSMLYKQQFVKIYKEVCKLLHIKDS